jgi:hypothetical protein
MHEDPIVEEIRKVREEHARRFGFDLEAIFKDLKAREEESGRRHKKFPPRPAIPASSNRPR